MLVVAMNRGTHMAENNSIGEACYEMSDNPYFEKIVELENIVKEDLIKELMELDQPSFQAHGSMLSGIIRGINKIQECRQMHKQVYIDEVLNKQEKEDIYDYAR